MYYDLEKLMKVMKQFRRGYTLKGVYEPGPVTADGKEVVFAFVGAGSILDKLVHYGKEHHFENIVFIPYQEKEDLIYSLNAGDVHWCVNAKEIKGVSCPSNVCPTLAVAKKLENEASKSQPENLFLKQNVGYRQGNDLYGI